MTNSIGVFGIGIRSNRGVNSQRRTQLRVAGWVFLAGMTLVTIFTVFCHRVYRSEAKIFVRLGRESVGLDPTVSTGPVVSLLESRDKELHSILEVMQSRWLREAVVRQLGADRILAGKDDAPTTAQGGESNGGSWLSGLVAAPTSIAEWLVSWLDVWSGAPRPDAATRAFERAVRDLEFSVEVSLSRHTNVIGIATEAYAPKLAQRITQAYIDNYFERHATLNRASGSHAFFAEQASHLVEELRQKQEALREFKSQANIGDLELRRELLMQRIGQRESALWQAEAEAAACQAKIDSATLRLKELPEMSVKEETSGHHNPAADEMRNQLYALQLREANLLAIHADAHPLVQQVRREIADAQAILDREGGARTQVTRATNRLREELQLGLLEDETQLAEAQANLRASAAQVAAGREELEALGRHEIGLVELQRELGVLDAQYRRYAENLDQTRIDEALEASRISNLNVVEPPTLVLRPVRPVKLMNLLGGLIGSSALALTVFLSGRSPAVAANKATESSDVAEASLPIQRAPSRELVAGRGHV